MKTLNVGEFKSHFSEVLEMIKKGKEVIISFGKKKEKIAIIVPYKNYIHAQRHLGVLKSKATFKIADNFKVSDSEFLT